MVDERALTAAGLAVADMPGDPACIDIARAAIAAYEAAKPVPPMSTSGEMVERLRELADGPNTVSAFGRMRDGLREAASRIEALEALVAAEREQAEHFRDRAIVDRSAAEPVFWQTRALSAEAALAKGGG